MTLYYRDEYVELYHGDCREERSWLEADVLVTDPPYGRNWKSGSGMTNAEGRGRGSKANGGILNDKDTTVRDAALSLWGADKPAVVFGDPLIQQPAGAVQALVYIKPLDAGIKGARAGFRRDVEMIYLVGPWSTGVGGSSSALQTGGLVAGLQVDVLQGLITRVPDGVIADPFAGSGSTLVAAAEMGRRAVGVELDEAYCEVIAKRLSAQPLVRWA